MVCVTCNFLIEMVDQILLQKLESEVAGLPFSIFYIQSSLLDMKGRVYAVVSEVAWIMEVRVGIAS